MRALILCLGVILSPVVHAGPEVSMLEQDLRTAQQVIEETQVEFQTALAGYNQESMRTVGSRLRELKLRCAQILVKLAAARETERRQAAGELLHQRREIARRLEALEPLVDQAATAFDEQPTPRRGARLNDLTVQEIGLRDDLATADAVAKERGDQDGAVTAGAAAVGVER